MNDSIKTVLAFIFVTAMTLLLCCLSYILVLEMQPYIEEFVHTLYTGDPTGDPTGDFSGDPSQPE